MMSGRKSMKGCFGNTPDNSSQSRNLPSCYPVTSSGGERRKRPRESQAHAAEKFHEEEDEFTCFHSEMRRVDETPFKCSKQNSGHIDPPIQSKPIHQTEDNSPDEFDGIDDADIADFDLTPYKNYANSTNSCSASPSLLPTVMQMSSSSQSSCVKRAVTLETPGIRKQEQTNPSLEETEVNTVTNLDSNQDAEDTEEVDEDRNAFLSLQQLTQEEVDFEALEEAGNNNILDEADVEQDNSNLTERDRRDSSNLKQPTLSQYYSKQEMPKRPAPKIADYLEFNGRHFFKGDVWEYVAIPQKAKDHVFSKQIVKIKGFTTKKGEKMAYVENKIHLRIENVPKLGPYAQSVIESRRLNGNTGPEYVEYSTTSTASSALLFPLKKFDKCIKCKVESDLIFGLEANSSTTDGCFFKFNDSATSRKKRISIPKDSSGRYTALDLYAGAGGFSLGLKNAGFYVTHHVDNDTAACSTLQANFPDTKVLQCRVEDFLTGCKENPTSKRYPEPGSTAVKHGSPPCQGYSLANRNGGANDAANNAETHRFMDALRHDQSPFATFENVEGLVQQKHKGHLQKVIAEFLKMEYQVRLCHLDASDYGDPQNRKRLIILAAKAGLELPLVPQPTHGDDPSLLRKRTCADTIGFLEGVPPQEYEGEVTAIFDDKAHVLRGHRMRSFETTKDDIKLASDGQAPTVIKRRVVRHYKCDKRPLTRLEQSLLQSFPLDFDFYGTDSEIRDQIGNAVPVCLATAIAKSVMDAIQRSSAE